MRFLLSIHDVWPGNLELAAAYLARCRSLGARHIALLVVPAFHGRADMERSPEFLAWLREESDAGTELFLHGYHHKMIERVAGASFPGRRSGYGRWVNRRLVGDEAEFCGLPAAESVRLLDLGLDQWSRTGLPMSGFVAPTWHGGPPEACLKERGIGLRESRFRVTRPADGRSRFVPPLAWNLSGNGGPRLFGGGAWLKAMLMSPLMKVAIHPGDFSGDGADRILERVLKAGVNIAYRDLFAPQDPGPVRP